MYKGLCQRFLVPLRGQTKEKPVIAFDVETYGLKNKFVLGAISYKGNHSIHYDASEMLAELGHQRNSGSLIYATNLHFDAFTLFQEVAGDRGIPEGWSAFDNGAKLIWCKRDLGEMRGNNRHVALLDSMNLFPIGVYNLGSILGKVAASYKRSGNIIDSDYFSVRKLDSPSCMGKKKLSNLTEEERKALTEYCLADATVTRKFMEWANREIIKLGANVKITAASTAMDLFRRKHLHQVIPQPAWECLIDSRFSYYGGRTEDFYKGNVGEAYEHDVTAMYPSCMEELNFPYPSPENFIQVANPTESCLTHEGFAKVTMIAPEMRIPLLPFKTMGHLLFPTGHLEGVWTHLEIRYALQLGYQLESISWSYYNTHTFNPFKPYVTELVKLRMEYLCPGCEQYDITGLRCWEVGRKCENAHATEEVIKLFLNGLYGKFAQNFLTEEEAIQLKIAIKKGGGTFKPLAEATPEEFEFTCQKHPEYLAKGIVINSAAPTLKSFMNPILASYVTSQARIKLHKLMIKALDVGAEVFYTDTDSIYSDKPLPFSTKAKVLGSLQLGPKIDELLIIGPKAKLTKSGTDSKATFKGVPAKSWLVTDSTTMASKPIAPKKDIFANMESDELKVTFTRFAKLREGMHRGLSANEMVQVTKEFKPFENPKRRILGKPSIKSLLSKRYDSKAWKVDSDTQLVIQ